MPEPKIPWGSGPELTVEERARVLARYSHMRGRSFSFKLTFPFEWVPARTPEELEAAVRQKLAADFVGKPSN